VPTSHSNLSPTIIVPHPDFPEQQYLWNDPVLVWCIPAFTIFRFSPLALQFLQNILVHSL